MIFVTVGTDEHQFVRLIKAMDEIAEKIKEPIIIQKGKTRYETKNAKSFAFENEKKIESYYKNARLIVGHAGAGTIIKALSYSKPIIVMPRLLKFNEHTNDHQLDLAKDLESKGVLRIANSEHELKNAIMLKHPPKKLTSKKKDLLETLKKFIKSIS